MIQLTKQLMGNYEERLLEIGVKEKKGLSGTEMRDSGLDPRGIVVIILIRVVIERHPLSKACGEWS